MNKGHSPDNESIPLDQMLQRLKDNSDGSVSPDKQVVTRDDGTEVVRVRKRKRRSNPQSTDEEKRQKKRIFLSLVLVVSLVLFTGLAFFVFLLKNNSTGYYEQVLADVSNASQGEVALDGLVIKPTSIALSGVGIKGHKAHYLRSLKVSGAKADKSLVSFFTGGLVGRDLVAEKGSIHLSLPLSQDAPPKVMSEGLLDFRSYKISKGSLDIGEIAPYFASIREASVSFTKQVNELHFDIGNGSCQFLGLPKLQLSNAFTSMSEGKLNIESLVLKTTNNGLIKVKDHKLLIADDVKTQVPFTLSRVDLDEIGFKMMAEIFEAEVSSSSGSQALFVIGKQEEIDLSVAFDRGKIKIKSFPFLYRLSESFGILNSQPTFKDISGVIKRDSLGISFKNMRLINTGRLALTGNLQITPTGALSGKLRVGINPRIAQDALGESILSKLSSKEEGFRWIEIEIGGSVRKPKDNFSQLLIQGGSFENKSSEPSGEVNSSQLDELFKGLDD